MICDHAACPKLKSILISRSPNSPDVDVSNVVGNSFDRLVLRCYSCRFYVWPDFVPTHERHADGALHRSAGRLGRDVSNIVLSRNSLYSSMSILDDLFDGEVFQFHVSVLGRNPAFLGVTGRSIVVQSWRHLPIAQ